MKKGSPTSCVDVVARCDVLRLMLARMCVCGRARVRAWFHYIIPIHFPRTHTYTAYNAHAGAFHIVPFTVERLQPQTTTTGTTRVRYRAIVICITCPSLCIYFPNHAWLEAREREYETTVCVFISYGLTCVSAFLGGPETGRRRKCFVGWWKDMEVNIISNNCLLSKVSWLCL